MNRFIQSSAEDDLVRQFEWYVQKGHPDIAIRFRGAVREAINALMAMPNAGTPKASANPQLAGLRVWPVKGFDEFRVYYLPRPDVVTILRILHDKRDVGGILDSHGPKEPDLP